jgi:hypothetical protein
MGLYERILRLEEPKLPVHAFQSVAAEWARGNLTGAQANTIIGALTGVPLDATAVAEATALVATVPTGSTATNKADRALRLNEIDQVLLLADAKAPGYDTVAALKARLGV